MYELEYLYEQLKTQEIIYRFSNTDEACSNLLETVELIQEASNNKLLSFVNKLKTDFAKSEKVLANNKDAALKCDPDGLVYKDYKTFIPDSEIEKMYKNALNYVNKLIDVNKASEEELKDFIKNTDRDHLLSLAKFFGGKDGRHFNMNKAVVKSEGEKEITKNDIKESIKLIETSKSIINKYLAVIGQYDEEIGNHVIGVKPDKSLPKIEKLRYSAKANKDFLKYMVDEYYYQMLITKVKQQSKQAKHIVVKAANFNPENLEESMVYQDYLDAMNEFEENADLNEAGVDKRNKNVVTPAKLLNKHIKKAIVTNEEKEESNLFLEDGDLLEEVQLQESFFKRDKIIKPSIPEDKIVSIIITEMKNVISSSKYNNNFKSSIDIRMIKYNFAKDSMFDAVGTFDVWKYSNKAISDEKIYKEWNKMFNSFKEEVNNNIEKHGYYINSDNGKYRGYILLKSPVIVKK